MKVLFITTVLSLFSLGAFAGSCNCTDSNGDSVMSWNLESVDSASDAVAHHEKYYGGFWGCVAEGGSSLTCSGSDSQYPGRGAKK